MKNVLKNRRLIGLSLSACVYDIAQGEVTEDQIIRIETDAQIDGFNADFQHNQKLLSGATLPTSSSVEGELIVEYEKSGRHDKVFRYGEYNADGKVVSKAILTGSWDLIKGRHLQQVLERSYVPAKTFRGSSWERYFTSQKAGGTWVGDRYEEYAEIATRLINAGKVVSYQNNSTADGRWVDADTGEIIRHRTLKNDPPIYVSRILELRALTDGEPVTKRESMSR